MSAFPDEPDHFVDWARRTGHQVEPTDFPPRMLYADYLRDLVAEFGDERLTVVDARVEDVVALESGFEITTAGLTMCAGAVVLAYGNVAPLRSPRQPGGSSQTPRGICRARGTSTPSPPCPWLPQSSSSVAA